MGHKQYETTPEDDGKGRWCSVCAQENTKTTSLTDTGEVTV